MASPGEELGEKADLVKQPEGEFADETTPEPKDPNLALLEAAEKLDLELVQKLLSSGASAAFVQRQEGGWGTLSTKSALHCAILSRSASSKPQFAVIEALVNAGADVNAKMENQCWTGRGSCRTAWDMVLDRALDDPALLRLFLSHGAKVNSSTTRSLGGMRNDGKQVAWLLNRVVRSGNVEVVRVLIECRADVNVEDSLVNHNERGHHADQAEAALHIASAAGNVPMARLLLENDAKVNVFRRQLLQEDRGLESPTDDPRSDDFVCAVVCRPLFQTALHLALRKGHAELATMLVCWGADTTCSELKRQHWRPRCRVDVTELHANAEAGDVLTSCEEMCSGDAALLKALRAEYAPETHHLFPSEARSAVKTLLMAAKRQERPLPQRILFIILLFAVPALSAPCSSSKTLGAADSAAEEEVAAEY